MSKSFLVGRQYNTVSPQSYRFQTNNITGATLSLTRAEAGDLIVLNSTNGTAVTLPNPVAGLGFNMVVGYTAGAHSIVAPAASLRGLVSAGTTGGNVSGNGLTTIYLGGTGGSAIGDAVSLRSDGVSYYISGAVNDYLGVVIA